MWRPVISHHSILTCAVSRILPVPHNNLKYVITLLLLDVGRKRIAMLPKASFYYTVRQAPDLISVVTQISTISRSPIQHSM